MLLRTVCDILTTWYVIRQACAAKMNYEMINLNDFVTFNQALCKPIGNSFIEDTTVLGMVLE